MENCKIIIVDTETMKKFEKDFNEKQGKMKIIERLNEQYGIDLWQLIENTDFLLLAKYVSEKQPFLYEPNKKGNK